MRLSSDQVRYFTSQASDRRNSLDVRIRALQLVHAELLQREEGLEEIGLNSRWDAVATNLQSEIFFLVRDHSKL